MDSDDDDTLAAVVPSMQNHETERLPLTAANTVDSIRSPHSAPTLEQTKDRVHTPVNPAGRSPKSLLKVHINEAGAREFLTKHEWPVGLQDSFIKGVERVPMRFFICDDSGSMRKNDGHRFIDISNGNRKLIDCTRWSELYGSMKFHADLARHANAPCEFRMLNRGKPITMGTAPAGEDSRENEDEKDKYDYLMSLFQDAPGSGTPLCRHVREVTEKIKKMRKRLKANNQKACIIICSDGEASDGNITNALLPLRNLPVWVVVRLCTDEENVVGYWGEIDSSLELDMDVLDDLVGEAEKVEQMNGWLTYGEPMHRLREFGIALREVDRLDNEKLDVDLMKAVCVMIFGGKSEAFPDPQEEWKVFLDAVKRGNERTPQVYNVVRRKNVVWIDVQKLNREYSSGGVCQIM